MFVRLRVLKIKLGHTSMFQKGIFAPSVPDKLVDQRSVVKAEHETGQTLGRRVPEGV